MDRRRFVEKYPELYHVTAAENLDGVRHIGLLSTLALAKKFGLSPNESARLSRVKREAPVIFHHGECGHAVIKDQRPLSPKKIAGLLCNGLTVEEYLELLNSRVFSWCCRKRLDAMRSSYSGRQCVLTIDSEKLMSCYWKQVQVCRYNSGSTRANNLRKRPIFEDLDTLDRDALPPIAEVTNADGVQNIANFIKSVG